MESHLKIAIAMASFFVILTAAAADETDICGVPVTQLMTCKPAVTPPNPQEPTQQCCDGISHADLKCFCGFLKDPRLPVLGIDPNLVLQIPGKCKLQTPSC